MNKPQKISLIFFFLLVIPFVHGLMDIVPADNQYYPMNQDNIIRFSVLDNSTLLSNQSCNIYIYATNGTMIYSELNVSQSLSGSYYTIFPASYSTEPNRYNYFINCNNQAYSWDSFQITEKGFPDDQSSKGMSLFVSFMIPLLVLILFLFGMIYMFNDMPQLKEVFYIGALVMLIPITKTVATGIFSLFHITSLPSEVIGVLHWYAWLMFGVISIFFIRWLISLFDFILQRKKKRRDEG